MHSPKPLGSITQRPSASNSSSNRPRGLGRNFACASPNSNLSVVPDGETENDLKEIWGPFLVARELHCDLSKARAEIYLPNFVTRQFGLIQTAPLPSLSTNQLSSWRADVAKNHSMAGISFQLQNEMTFLTLMP
ncbi:hypothetical protein Pyn_32242 [Prunus yedoensis var. nudiflora]|uniref:Uncharacterized protein n=1 Tax=Prunus yedoensis var. nudiflora TaxID=2094558 RepID=A0A314YB15_PRUYE|nr:hypothetical protein Pyn_32242 [Prunus yedoensis var. nudiflora]